MLGFALLFCAVSCYATLCYAVLCDYALAYNLSFGLLRRRDLAPFYTQATTVMHLSMSYNRWAFRFRTTKKSENELWFGARSHVRFFFALYTD